VRDQRRAVRVIGLISTIVIAASAGYAAYVWRDLWPATAHGAVFTAGSLLSAAIIGIGAQVFAKLDRLIEAAERFPYETTSRVYDYVSSARAWLSSWLVGAFVGLMTTAACAYLLKDAAYAVGQITHATRLTIAIGYASLLFVLLAAVRVLSAYLGLDHFRKELFRAIEDEKRRADTLRAMRPASAIEPFEIAPTSDRKR
jgi:hypothetical protein